MKYLKTYNENTFKELNDEKDILHKKIKEINNLINELRDIEYKKLEPFIKKILDNFGKINGDYTYVTLKSENLQYSELQFEYEKVDSDLNFYIWCHHYGEWHNLLDVPDNTYFKMIDYINVNKNNIISNLEANKMGLL